MRALIRFDCFGVILMTTIITSLGLSSIAGIKFDFLSFYPNAVPATEFHRSVASLAPERSWQSHIPFG